MEAKFEKTAMQGNAIEVNHKDKLSALLAKYQQEYAEMCKLYKTTKSRKEKWIAEGTKHALAYIINDLTNWNC